MTVDQVVLVRFPAKMRVDILPQPGANAATRHSASIIFREVPLSATWLGDMSGAEYDR